MTIALMDAALTVVDRAEFCLHPLRFIFHTIKKLGSRKLDPKTITYRLRRCFHSQNRPLGTHTTLRQGCFISLFGIFEHHKFILGVKEFTPKAYG